MIERDEFHKRFLAEESIGLHEFLYPLMQGYDSVALECDVELGGTDQRFNLARVAICSAHYGQKPQIILMTPILEGLDGVQKMSKSLGNAIGINEPPGEMYGKLMSISDELMGKYYVFLTDLSSRKSMRCWQTSPRANCIPWKRRSGWRAALSRTSMAKPRRLPPMKTGRGCSTEGNCRRPGRGLGRLHRYRGTGAESDSRAEATCASRPRCQRRRGQPQDRRKGRETR